MKNLWIARLQAKKLQPLDFDVWFLITLDSDIYSTKKKQVSNVVETVQ
jgi:hypothetical protein